MIALYKLLYYITNKPYFMVVVTKHGRRVKKFIQLASAAKDGNAQFLIDKSLKMAWWKPETPIIDGLQFHTVVDIDNAIPLVIEPYTVYNSGEFIITEKTYVKIKEDVEKQKKNPKNGRPEQYAEIKFPPTLLFQISEARFVDKTLEEPPSMLANLSWIYIVGLVVAGLIIFYMVSGGKLF